MMSIEARSYGRKWVLLAGMSLVLGVVLLDETIVGVALPTIAQDLSLSQTEGHWVINAYLLVFAVLAAAAGRLGDMVSRLGLFVIGVAVFGLASLGAGFAPSGEWLIAARALEGVGAAIVFPASLAIITHAFPPQQRGMAIGIYGGVGTFFLSLGPFVGGLFVEYFSWRWIFWINPFVALVIAGLTIAGWRAQAAARDKLALDTLGFVSLTAGLTLLVFGSMQAAILGWEHLGIWFCLVLGALILGAFVLVELRAPSPLIDVALFRSHAFTTYNAVVFSAQFGKVCVFVFVAIFLQNTLGLSALQAGLVILAGAVPTFLTSPPAGMMLERMGGRALLVPAAFLSVVSAIALAVGIAVESLFIIIPALVVWGGAISFLFVPSLRDVMGAVPPEKRGEAGGISMTAQLLGGVVGMTVASLLV
ncbi:MAG: MFS transporter, partial [Pseudomonadota bacterium]